MIIKTKLFLQHPELGLNGEVELELDTARDAARIDDEAAKYGLKEQDKVTTNTVFKVASKLISNLVKDMEKELYY